MVFHVLNRANNRDVIIEVDEDYLAFPRVTPFAGTWNGTRCGRIWYSGRSNGDGVRCGAVGSGPGRKTIRR